MPPEARRGRARWPIAPSFLRNEANLLYAVTCWNSRITTHFERSGSQPKRTQFAPVRMLRRSPISLIKPIISFRELNLQSRQSFSHAEARGAKADSGGGHPAVGQTTFGALYDASA